MHRLVLNWCRCSLAPWPGNGVEITPWCDENQDIGSAFFSTNICNITHCHMARNWGMAPFETINSKGTAMETATGESFLDAEDSGSSKFVIVVWPRELSLWLMSFSFLCSEYSFQSIGRLRGYGNPPEKMSNCSLEAHWNDQHDKIQIPACVYSCRGREYIFRFFNPWR